MQIISGINTGVQADIQMHVLREQIIVFHNGCRASVQPQFCINTSTDFAVR